MTVNDGTLREAPYRNDANSTIVLMNVLNLLLRNILLILGIGILFAVMAYSASFLIPNYFRATTQILLDPEGSRIIENDLSNPTRAVEAHALNQQYIITSSQVLSRVVESEKLYDDPKFGAAPPVYSDRESRTKLALDALRNAIGIQRSDKSFVVDLTVKAESADKAAHLANAIATAYTDVRIEMNSGVMRKASDGLAAQLDQLKKAVEDGDRNVQTYKAANNLLDAVGVAGTGRPAIEQQITEANTEISKLATTIAENEAMVTDLARARSDREYLRSVPDIYLTQAIISLRARYHESLEEEAVLAASLGNRHPSLQAARSRTRSISGILDEQLRNFTTSASRNLEKLKNQLTILRGNANTLKSRLNGDGQSMVRLRELERKLESDRLVYESFLLRTRQLSEQERTTSENPQIISIAEPPLKKAGPPRTVMGIGGGLFGLVLGVGLVLLRDQFGGQKNRVVTPAPIAPVRREDSRRERERTRDLALALERQREKDRERDREQQGKRRRPSIRGREDKADNTVMANARDDNSDGTPGGLLASLRARFLRSGRNDASDHDEHGYDQSQDLEPRAERDQPQARVMTARAFQDDDDDGATNGSYVTAMLAQDKEGYAAFARTIAASRPPGGNYSVMVVAAGPKNRAPYVAFNLAAAAARQGRQVLLVDAAIHDPALTASLALSSHAGLGDIIAERRFDETRLVKFEIIPHLWFMPAGRPAQDRRRGKNDDTLTDWLEDDDRMFDLVVIDAGTVDSTGIPAEVERTVDDILLIRHENDAGGAGAALEKLEDRGMGSARIVTMGPSGFSTGFGN